jgi:hypothetical protein
MKVTAVVLYENAEMEFEISVGAGDKTFKWFGMAACQRFATQHPNGALRRRDPVRRGMSDLSTHHSTEIVLENGQKPHPSSMLEDFLRDGDKVTVKLIDNQAMDRNGVASETEWASLAYTVNGTGIGEVKKEVDTVDNSDKEMVREGHTYTSEQKKGRAKFMRIILKSQMPDLVAIRAKVTQQWKRISKNIINIAEEEKERLIDVFVDNWDMLNELHEYFATEHNGQKVLLSEDWRTILAESGIFSEADLDIYSGRILKTAHADTAKDKDSLPALDIAGFMMGIVLVAQTYYNDRYDTVSNKLTPSQSTRKIFSDNLFRAAERYEMRCMLKEHFCSEENLNNLKEWRDELFDVFNKYAGRTKELPTSISHKDFTDMLWDAKLIEATETDTKGNAISFEMDTAAALLKSVRTGTIVGRPVVDEEAKKTSDLPDDIIPDDEFTFSEMVEAICRHSFNWYRGTKPDEDGNIVYLDYGGEYTINDCIFKGIVGVVATLNKK